MHRRNTDIYRRGRRIKSGKSGQGPVVYWMSRDQRVADNWGILWAQQEAIIYERSLLVIFCLTPDFPDTTPTQIHFILKGLQPIAKELHQLDIGWIFEQNLPDIFFPKLLSDIDAQHSGNAIAAIGISLGTHIADPLARLQAIRQSVQAAREHLNSLPTDAVDSYAMLSSMPIVASQMPVVGRFVPPLFNVGISNVAGDDKPLYFNGARLEALYPMSQLMQYSALSIACVSYAGTLNVGLTGARDTLPHLQRLAVYMGQALTDLEDIMHAVEDAG